MKLIVEDFDTVETVIVEDTQGTKKDVFIEGIFAQANIKNRNGRIYPKPILEGQISKYITEFVDKNRAVGELNHRTDLSINPDRISHKIIELKWVNENDVYGKAKLTNTPKGNLVRNLVIDDGVVLGVSTRGVGTVKTMNEAQVVQADFYLKCWDIVSDPSAPDAFVNGIMEGKEWIFKDGILIEQEIEELQKSINKQVSKGTFDAFAMEQVFKNVLQKL